MLQPLSLGQHILFLGADPQQHPGGQHKGGHRRGYQRVARRHGDGEARQGAVQQRTVAQAGQPDQGPLEELDDGVEDESEIGYAVQRKAHNAVADQDGGRVHLDHEVDLAAIGAGVGVAHAQQLGPDPALQEHFHTGGGAGQAAAEDGIQLLHRLVLRDELQQPGILAGLLDLAGPVADDLV